MAGKALPLRAIAESVHRDPSIALQRWESLQHRYSVLKNACNPYWWHFADATADPPTPDTSNGAALPRLSGAFAAVDDVFHIKGCSTSIGVPDGLGFNFVSKIQEEDCPLIAAVRSEGAQFTGKTSVKPFNYKDAPRAKVVNPWRFDAGIPSGAASCVAAGLSDFGISAQTFGGVVVGAGKTGLVGWKATPESLPTEGMWRNSKVADSHGFFTRTVDDMIYLAETVAGACESHISEETPLNSPGKIRIGAVRQWSGYSQHAHEEIERTVTVLQQCPAIEVVDMDHRLLGDLADPGRLMDAACHLNMQELVRNYLGETDPNPAFGYFHNFAMSMALFSLGELRLYELEAQISRHRQFIKLLFQDARVDLMITPIAPQAFTTPEGTAGNVEFTLPFAVAGRPAVALPLGCVSGEGVPFGVQLVGKPHGDLQLLHMARLLEGVLEPLQESGLVPPWEQEAFEFLSAGSKHVNPKNMKKKKKAAAKPSPNRPNRVKQL